LDDRKNSPFSTIPLAGIAKMDYSRPTAWSGHLKTIRVASNS
jgi:hypothetical protein